MSTTMTKFPLSSSQHPPRFLKRVVEKFIEPEDLISWRSTQRVLGKTVATLNGSFDILHSGHLHIIYEASLTADVLLLLLNSDRSIQSYKGPSRPIHPLAERIKLIAAIEFVHFVSFFDEKTPCQILEIVAPDVHVNGAEYAPRCIEQDVVEMKGGRVHFVDRIEGRSTTAILQNIQTR